MRFSTMTILAAATLSLSAAASVPQLVRQAIETGRAAGNVDGPIADAARTTLNATGALTLAIKRVHLFEQAGCARLQLDFTQDAALLPGAGLPAPYSWSTRMNICADGHPPSTPKRRSSK
jgi:hypothetical protein